MSNPNRNAPAKASPLKKVLLIIYWVVFALALVIVLVFIAFKLFVKEPDVGDNQVIVPPKVTLNLPGDADSSEGNSSDAQELVLHRTDGVYTCLLAGTDDGNGNADTIMLGVFDTVNKTASLISIPRDTLVQVNGSYYKINATYALGGLELVRETVSDLLAVPVDFYVGVDLAAFQHIVDEIGGVWFTVPQDMDYDDPYQDLHIHISAGYQLLNGEDALKVMRYRSGYANADLGRVQVQREFLVAMVKQTVSLSNVSKVTSLIEILNQYVASDMPVSNMVYFATQAIGMDLNTALESSTLPGDWVSPYMELRDDEVLALVNSLGIYEEEIPAEALHICHK